MTSEMAEVLMLGSALAASLAECLRESFDGQSVEDRRKALRDWDRCIHPEFK